MDCVGVVSSDVFVIMCVVVSFLFSFLLVAPPYRYTTLTTMKRHPHLLSLIGGVVSNHQVWLVFTFLPGGSVASRLLQDPTWGRTDLLRTLHVAIGMASGVAALHAQGYLHRDRTSRVPGFFLCRSCVIVCVFPLVV